MSSISLVLNIGILVLLLRYLLKTSNVLKTTLMYAGSYFILGILFSLSSLSPIFVITLCAVFLFDMATGFVYFWLIERFQDNLYLFYLIVIGGIALNFGLKIAIPLMFV
jgi:hypothetical protein